MRRFWYGDWHWVQHNRCRYMAHYNYSLTASDVCVVSGVGYNLSKNEHVRLASPVEPPALHLGTVNDDSATAGTEQAVGVD